MRSTQAIGSTAMKVEGREVQLDDHLHWMWCARPNGHILKVDCRVIGFTAKRIRVLVFDSEGEPVTKTVDPASMLWPRSQKHPSPHLTCMVGQGNANDLEKWLAFNRTLTWDRLAPPG
jgi:hypothetical protein